MLFFRLGSAPLMLWDESRLAVNAAEMLARREWLVTTFGQQPDLWNTKPPLMIWLQALSIKTLGYTQLAVRLPSALAALATILLVFRFGARQLGSPLLGWLAALVLLSTAGFVCEHVARTGDYDALLIGWTTLGTLAFSQYMRTHRAGLGLLAAAAFALAVLTKGIAGVLFAPALLLFTWRSGQLGWLLRQRAFYLGLGGFGLVIAGYYGLREQAAPGYLAAVWANELGGRALQALDGHQEPWSWYWKLLTTIHFSLWLLPAISGLLLGLRQPRLSALREFAELAGLVVGGHLLLISLVQTKLEWYVAPIYPFLALLAAMGLTFIHTAVIGYFQLRPPRPWQLLAFGLLVCWLPYLAILNRLDTQFQRRFAQGNQQFGRYLAGQAAQQPTLTAYTMLSSENNNAPLDWYALAMQAAHGHRVERRYGSAATSLRAGQTVVVCAPRLRQRLESAYATELLFAQDSCATLRILGALAPK